MERFKISLTVFLTAFSAICIEILFTKLFSAIYFSSFTFFIISMGLFGTGLSGLQFAISEGKKITPENFIYIFAVTLPVILLAVINIKIDFLMIFNSFTNIFNLAINFILLIIPFFLSGAVLVRLFSAYSSQIGKLYFFDLLGAAIGAIIIIPLISELGVINFFITISITLLLLLLFIIDTKKQRKSYIWITMVLLIVLLIFSGSLFKIIPKIEKRDFLRDQKRGSIEYSSWSPINKIDIAPFAFSRNRKVIWLNCGTQQSWLVKTEKNSKKINQVRWTQASIPYQLTARGSAFIIGSAGGFEVYCALSNGFKKIVAVEMDPGLCDLVKGKYSDFIGDIFHRRGVYLINDEGRSVLNRLDKKFDVIQMVNSHPRDTLLSGGLSISETYIYTIEAFREYWDHLNKNGILSVVHIYGERIFSTALKSLRDLKVKEPEKKFFVVQAHNGFNYFFMKKGDINSKDIDILSKFAGNREISFSPDRKKNNIYYRLAFGNFNKTVRDSSVNISPVNDRSPYLNQPNHIGQLKFKNNFIKGMARDKVYRVLKYTNYVYISILLLTFLFSFFLIYLPMKKFGDQADKKIILYFFLIGAGYISIEIIFIKIFQLMLGNPAYSISMILFSLLISSGTGSFYSDRIFEFFKKSILSVAIFISIILLIYSLILFPIIYGLMTLPLFLRLLISVILIIIPGIPLGVFFPLGIKSIGKKEKNIIGWAWSANGFATILGSVITVIISINLNFSVVFIISAMIYLSAALLFPESR